jgi:phytoene desaturase
MLDVSTRSAQKPTQAANRPHAVVIGSGFGGLAAAVRLGAKGYRVTVLEKLDAPGGRAYVHRQDGFTFDAGPTIITAPFLFEELWRLCGRKLADDVTLKPVSPFYRIRFDDGAVFDCSGDPTAMRAEVARFSPADVAGYEQFMQASEAIFKVGFEELGDVPFHSWTTMARIAPQMLRLKSYRSVYGLVSSYIRDERLRTVLSFHPLLIGGNPFTATSIYCLISFLERRWGVHFAMGGTGELVRGLVRLIEGQGGAVHCSAGVSEITVRDGVATGVRLADGETIAADIVVSNADSAWTYRHLLPGITRRRWTDRRIARARYSMSLFVWYFGTRRRYEDVAHHTILLGPRYRGLLEDIFERKVLADDFSLYLHRPTATDPSLAPQGCDAFYVLSPVPHLQSGIDWAQQGERYRKKIEQALSGTVLPDLADHVVTSRLLTPIDFQDRLSSYRGAAFGLEPILTQSAWFRPHNRSEEVGALYLVGAGTHPGAGLPGVLSSARVLDDLVPDAHAMETMR